MRALADDGVRQPAAPVDPSHRISALDALRGLALFGVLANTGSFAEILAFRIQEATEGVTPLRTRHAASLAAIILRRSAANSL